MGMTQRIMTNNGNDRQWIMTNNVEWLIIGNDRQRIMTNNGNDTANNDKQCGMTESE